MILLSEKFSNLIDKCKAFSEKDFVSLSGLYFCKDNIVRLNNNYYLLGVIDFIIENGKRKRVSGNYKEIVTLLAKCDIRSALRKIDGSFFLIKSTGNKISIYSDVFCKKDLFYYRKGKEFIISDSLECFKSLNLMNVLNQISLVSFFTLYGNYTPKKHTLYKNINRLGVNQFITAGKNGMKVSEISFKPLKVLNYKQSNLDEYSKIISDSVKFRSTETGINWIYLSSGWDSTAILAILRNLYPAERIRGVIGEMIYSERSGVINKYEIDRAKKIANYYNVKLDVLKLNYTKPSIVSYLENIIPFMRENSIFSFNSINFLLLSDFIRKNSSEDDKIFSGEISDGIHNLGFSQYATVLEHPDLNFREYADKMASYLFGPTFLKSILENNYENDLIYNFFRRRYLGNKFYSVLNKSDKYKKTELLSSFFLSPRRIPFYSVENLSLLTGKAIEEYKNIYQSDYLNNLADKMNPSNIYSVILHLYSIFHWQGSTVKVIGRSLERFDKTIELPFWDMELHKFLSQMPESWGRGLDLNKTKFPLKWVLENKFDYPIGLQKGPHSYLYDSNPRFNHLEEILNGKVLNNYFKSRLDYKSLKDNLDDKYFNLNYIKRIIKEYKNNIELKGQALIDIGSIILFSLIQDS